MSKRYSPLTCCDRDCAAANAMTLDEAIAHAEDVADRCDTSCGREHRQLADWLKELRDVKSRNVGNAAAMREALEDVLEKIDRWRTDGVMEHWQYSQLFDIADSALSKPARNCDLYDNWYDAHQAWERLPKDELGYFVAENGVHECEQAWLFAPATERKGE